MKSAVLTLIVLGLLVSVGVLLAQSVIISADRRVTKFQSYDPKTPPPLSLPEAYSLALGQLGKIPGATNRFHCISASCIEMPSIDGWTGWTFWFAKTNGERARMWVFFDGGVTSDVHDGEVFTK